MRARGLLGMLTGFVVAFAACSQQPARNGAPLIATATALPPEPPPAQPPAPSAAPPAAEADAAPPSAAAAASRTAPLGANDRILYIGHSLINLNVPFIVKQLAEAAGHPVSYRAQINNGATLKAQWEKPDHFNPIPIWNPDQGKDEDYGANAQKELATGRYGAFVLTEAGPIFGHMQYSDSVGILGKYYDLATRRRPDIRVYLYQTWPELSADKDWRRWRTQLASDRAHWEHIIDEVMRKRPGAKLHLLPGGPALAALYDALNEPGAQFGTVRRLEQLFDDAIHMNDTGNYFIGLVFYATLFGKSPVGLGEVQAGPYTRNRTITDEPTRRALARLAWDVVKADPRSGVSGS